MAPPRGRLQQQQQPQQRYYAYAQERQREDEEEEEEEAVVLDVELPCELRPPRVGGVGAGDGFDDGHDGHDDDAGDEGSIMAALGGGGGGGAASADVEPLRLRVLARSDGGGLLSVRVEVTSDQSLFFCYAAEVDAAAYRDLRAGNRLAIGFPSLPGLLRDLAARCAAAPGERCATLTLRVGAGGERVATLAFEEALPYKASRLRLLSVPLAAAPAHAVRARVAAMYGALAARNEQLQEELARLRGVVRQRAPHLLSLPTPAAAVVTSAGGDRLGLLRAR